MLKTCCSPKVSTYVYLSSIVAVSMFFLLYKYFLQIFPAVMVSVLQKKFHLSAFDLGNLAGCFFYAYFIMQIFSGPILDRWPLKYVSAIAMALAAAGLLLFSLSNTWRGVLLARLFMGAGASFATVSYLKMAAIFFEKNFAPIAGLLTFGVMIGALVGQAPLAYGVLHIGWSQVLRLAAFVGVLVSVAYLLFPKNTQDSSQSVFFSGMYTVAKQKANWFLLFYSGFAFAPLAVLGSLWGIPFVQVVDHLSVVHSSEVVSWLYVGFGLGGICFGYIKKYSDSVFLYMFVGLAISLTSLVLFIYSGNQNPIYQSVLLWCLGFGTGAFMLGFDLGKQMNSLALAATMVAFINTGDAFLGGISDPLIGHILDALTSFHHVALIDISAQKFQLAFVVLPLYLILAAIFLAAVKRSQPSAAPVV